VDVVGRIGVHDLDQEPSCLPVEGFVDHEQRRSRRQYPIKSPSREMLGFSGIRGQGRFAVAGSGLPEIMTRCGPDSLLYADKAQETV
jgi:hypothetical protein